MSAVFFARRAPRGGADPGLPQPPTLTTAIETLERISAVEVVVSVRRRAARYPHVYAMFAVAAAMATLAYALYGQPVFSLMAIVIDPFVAGGLAALFVELVPSLARWLTPRAWLARRVRAAARATYVERGVENTEAQSGMLVYVALGERLAMVVADRAVREVLGEPQLLRLEAALTKAIALGEYAVAVELLRLQPELARLPRSLHDRDELPNTLDLGTATTSLMPAPQREPAPVPVPVPVGDKP